MKEAGEDTQKSFMSFRPSLGERLTWPSIRIPPCPGPDISFQVQRGAGDADRPGERHASRGSLQTASGRLPALSGPVQTPNH